MRNVGSLDRIIRIVLGVAIIAGGIFAKSWWGVLGAIPVLTAALGFCPLYRIIGLSTCPLSVKKPR